MNERRLSANLLVIVLIAILSIPVVDAKATVTKEYEKDNFDLYGNLCFSYNVKVVIESEEDGKWVTSENEKHYYNINLVVTLTYVNQSIFPHGFQIIFHSPHLAGFGAPGYQEVTKNDTLLTLGQTGSLILRCYVTREQRFELSPSMRYKIWVDYGWTFFGDGWWDSYEPIYIYSKTPQRSFIAIFLDMLPWIGVLGAVLVIALVIVKRRS